MNPKELIQKLRESTGAGIMECKKALEKSKNDFEKALNLLKKQGRLKAGQKKERKTGAGFLEAYIHNQRVGVLLEIRSETDFVSRSPIFKELAHEITLQIAAMAPADISELLKQLYIKNESLTIADLINQTIAKVGENIQVERFCRYEI
ncbi:translation elongation factor Ts [Candidatus Jorgensenbacteria bacterium CG_4_8_14_3_um_filter_38_10]|uniref:Elongation factor Ts n=1 Tax=Candidatus Jorgensenbacteria bacterium CG11_big_fil_rev_8_21_14_0_20_38_23 TaxID=1974594 RepID=A0A2H0NF53_9BACT|nr:MAG: translation elongation factor Ts [Candidatus Jorgensenbacteria bacterium CG11_big_fil_rev_8_21_14_0_20_38_23]PIV13431.1 MAG: translation elongation factor Ts [Candidatus Jorgensenbacteria bacterium CG03_land_8_20_14_0_80_38_39]PIW97425.1 MAG: translation elongation factor Ts [Candidatus Jorgensenbacteria bacterium CG_4_8_14_3_um_filter_38_10]PJA95181.1 MAG: translation elongation factor Ts [Candidatus Jorgensenbacteria bacterium CG_4_9_14_3_um_filter_38_10]